MRQITACSLLLPQGQKPSDTSTTVAATTSRLVFWVFVCLCTFILFIGHEALVARVRVQLMSTSALKRDVWVQDRGRGEGLAWRPDGQHVSRACPQAVPTGPAQVAPFGPSPPAATVASPSATYLGSLSLA